MDRDPHFLGTYPDETEIGRFNRLCRARYAEHFATPGWPKGWYCENGSWFWWEHSMYHCKWQGEWYVWVVGQDEWILSENKDDPMDVEQEEIKDPARVKAALARIRIKSA